jgi:hypothetical protein
LDEGYSGANRQDNQRLAVPFDNNINCHYEKSMKLKVLNLILFGIFSRVTEGIEEIGIGS